ncbi:MAG: DUF2283 domain-containing protein [Chloroflexota bacterium]
MKLTYDPRADAAYLLMGEPLVRGQVASTYLCDPSEIDGMINLDFDKEGRLLGIEILDASKRLAPSVLSLAVPYGTARGNPRAARSR